MNSSQHVVRLDPEPPDLLAQLEPVLKAQGTPAITASRAEGGGLQFHGRTAGFMLQARVADALTTVCPGWHDRLVR